MMIASLLAALAAAQSAPAPSVGKVRMQLFYEDSGRLSEDIAPPAEFIGWNTVIGEGLSGGAESIGPPLSVVVRGSKGKVLGQRRFADVLTSSDGRTWKALWLTDVGCAGSVEVTATLGRSTRKAAVGLDCGE